ncbi:MAG: ATP synthase F0 subunit B [Deltaproteobacteria bacterium]|nr:ATP synthase F0 subunit B [Deltaproteobacteria bacterium]
MGHGPELIPDFTLFIQLGLFLACYWVLRTCVFGPYLRLLHLRHEQTLGLRQKAGGDKEQAEKLHAEYESFMKEERNKASAWLDEERKKIAEEERSIIQGSRTQVSEELKAFRIKIASECEKTKKELLPQVTDFASKIASRAIGQKVNVSEQSEGSAGKGHFEQTSPG